MVYDLLIIGAGPAGYTASIYASRYKLSNLIIGKELGGTAIKAHLVENWPGEKSIPGIDLMKKIQEHAQSLGAEVKIDEVIKIEKKEPFLFNIFTAAKNIYQAKTVVFALGTRNRKLNIQGEDVFIGKGVSYCTACDAFFFKNKVVAVVGGGDSAVTGALHLSQLAKHVYLICRGEQLKAEPIWQDRLAKKENVTLIFNTNVTEIKGQNKVEQLVLDKIYEGSTLLSVDGIFIEIGSVPSTSLLKDLQVNLNDQQYAMVNFSQETNIAGVYAAGDITNNFGNLRQMVTAAAEGAAAANAIFHYLQKNNS